MSLGDVPLATRVRPAAESPTGSDARAPAQTEVALGDLAPVESFDRPRASRAIATTLQDDRETRVERHSSEESVPARTAKTAGVEMPPQRELQADTASASTASASRAPSGSTERDASAHEERRAARGIGAESSEPTRASVAVGVAPPPTSSPAPHSEANSYSSRESTKANDERRDGVPRSPNAARVPQGEARAATKPIARGPQDPPLPARPQGTESAMAARAPKAGPGSAKEETLSSALHAALQWVKGGPGSLREAGTPGVPAPGESVPLAPSPRAVARGTPASAQAWDHASSGHYPPVIERRPQAPSLLHIGSIEIEIQPVEAPHPRLPRARVVRVPTVAAEGGITRAMTTAFGLRQS